MSKDVSVIVTAMTDAESEFINRTITSIYSSGCFEKIIVCVDCNSRKIKNELRKLPFYDYIHFLEIPLSPIGKVRNYAVKEVKTEWVSFCDGDDIWYQNKLKKQIDFALRYNADLVGCDHMLIDEKDKKCAYSLSKHLPMLSSWLVKTDFLRKYPFNETLVTASDGDWWIRTHEKMVKIRFPIPLVGYRVRSGSLSSITYSKKKKQILINISQYSFVRNILLTLTKLMWRFYRKEEYEWNNNWNKHVTTRGV